MNTSNTYLRYFTTDDNGEETEEVFVSVAELEYSGCPIDENECYKDNDCCLYRFNHETKQFEKLP